MNWQNRLSMGWILCPILLWAPGGPRAVEYFDDFDPVTLPWVHDPTCLAGGYRIEDGKMILLDVVDSIVGTWLP